MSRNAPELAVSVVIPTHNPREDYLARVLDALKQQTLPREQWELLLVDNGSKQPLRAAGLRDQEPSVARQREAQPRANEGFNNGSPKINIVDLSWHGNARIIREEELGLTFARLRGFAEAKGELIVMVDDDNVLAPDYLETAVRIAQEHPSLGAFGGKCLPEFEVEPEGWLASVTSGLGLRDLGEAPQLFPEETGGGLKDQETKRLKDEEGESGKVGRWEGGKVKRAVLEFPDRAPIGAGMVLRRDAAAAYAERIKQRTTGRRDNGTAERSETGCLGNQLIRDHGTTGRLESGGQRTEDGVLPKNRNTEPPNHRAASVITDRRGDSLASGGDNDICLTVLEEGWQVGYLPQLQLTHLIPKGRMTLNYHKRMARDSMKSFILMLDQHGMRPWPAMPKWTLPLRVASDWWRVKPWRGPEELLRFWGHLGMYEGRAALAAKQKPARSESSQ